MMKIEVSGIHVPIQEEVDKHIRQKVEKLTKYLDRIVSAKVILKMQRETYITEINVLGSRTSVYGEGISEDLYVSIDKAVDKVRRQVRKVKEKLKSHKHRARLAQERMSSEHESLPGARSEVIHITRQIAKPMNMDEAAMQLDLSQEKFLVFLNAATEQVNVMYKMTSGGYGLIEPQL
jgi:putative sigma-54 modulation protein